MNELNHGVIYIDLGRYGHQGVLRLNLDELHQMLTELIPGEDSAEKTRRVEALRAENEKSSSSGVRFSRLCRGCFDSNPSERVVLTHCGHAVCRTCADAVARHSTMQCPTCEKLSFFVRLFEERTTGEEDTADARDASFSRVCGVCYASNPAVRAAVKSCGHVACMACIEQMKSGERVKCPFCRENAPIVRLIEFLLSPDDGTDQGVWELPENFPAVQAVQNPAAPAVENHAAPAVENRAAPAVENLAAPAVENRAAPAVENRAAPAVENLAAPAVENPAFPPVPGYYFRDNSYGETAMYSYSDRQAEEDAAVPDMAEAPRVNPYQHRVAATQGVNPYAHLDNSDGESMFYEAEEDAGRNECPFQNAVVVSQPAAVVKNSDGAEGAPKEERADDGRQSIFCCLSTRFRGFCG